MLAVTRSFWLMIVVSSGLGASGTFLANFGLCESVRVKNSTPWTHLCKCCADLLSHCDKRPPRGLVVWFWSLCPWWEERRTPTKSCCSDKCVNGRPKIAMLHQTKSKWLPSTRVSKCRPVPGNCCSITLLFHKKPFVSGALPRVPRGLLRPNRPFGSCISRSTARLRQ